MPIENAKYRVVKTDKGPVRIATVKGKVVEAKNLKTGAMMSRDMRRMMDKQMPKGVT